MSWPYRVERGGPRGERRDAAGWPPAARDGSPPAGGIAAGCRRSAPALAGEVGGWRLTASPAASRSLPTLDSQLPTP
ncbi:hypothetical protein O0235_08905 [Tepidiforma flava]|uniref:Uncharacterized protein n=1 Tax=Tepidiforma flava TaxID=3004094 RepID=A0ABY7M2K7_9CHLR|nr:hypothetical protein [Tepidiforma flava]WBL34911.1 hypothetical protein O0235_08905 [Tepidiforma flava]